MPLSAKIEDKIVIGPDLSKDEWEDLKRKHRDGLTVTMTCCGANGHLRTSKKGHQHFYHESGSVCGSASESLEHLEIKYQIYRLCRDAGWETFVEYRSEDGDWIADVYTKNAEKQIVFEV